MRLYLNELAPWERKKEYYHTIQMGKNVKEQTEAINNQTKAMVASQMASTSVIIASQERIADGIDAVACGVGRVEEGIYELKAAFEWGISEVVWQIEQNRAVLKDILEVLMAPLDTQAKERRKRAEEAYANGWHEDAEEEFLESEKLNKFDFSIHISLGMIYLFHKVNKEKALAYFEKAIKYSKPKSAFHTSYALLHKALIKFDMGEIDEAEINSSEAIELSSNFTEALYQNAQYNAQLQRTDKSISNLKKAIRADKLYCLKAHSDPLFDPIRKDVTNLFEQLRNEEKHNALAAFERISKKHNASSPIISDISKESFIDASSWVTKSKKLRNELNKLDSKIKRNSYFDFLEVNNTIILDIQKDQDDLLSELKQRIKSSVKSFEQNITQEKSKHESNIKDYLGHSGSAILISSFAVPSIVSLLVFNGWDKLSFLLFLIPVVSQGLQIFYLYNFATRYSEFDPEYIVFCWSLVLYLILSVIYFFISKASSTSDMTSNIKKQRTLKETAIPYWERVKNL